MNKEFRKLLAQKNITGEQVGQALIRDMVHVCFDAWAAPDEKPEPLLSEDEKQRLVSMLTDPQDVRVYGQYRSVQTYLSNYVLVHTSLAESAESAFARIYSPLVSVRQAEQARAHLLQEGVPEDSRGMSELSRIGYEEVFLGLHQQMTRTARRFTDSMRMCVAHQRGLEMVADRIGVAEIMIYAQMAQIPYENLSLLMLAKHELQQTLARTGRSQGEIDMLDEIIPQIGKEDLEPGRAEAEKTLALLRENLSVVEDPISLVMMISGNGRDRR